MADGPRAKMIGRICASTGPRGEGIGGYWYEIGALLQRPDGKYFVSLKALPISPTWDGFCHVFPVEGGPGGRRKRESPNVKLSDFGDSDDGQSSD